MEHSVEQPKHVPIEDTKVFQSFRKTANRIWRIVAGWNSFAQNTVGSQLVRAADSVCANLVEGGGRTSYADSLRFFGIARASARETIFWVGIAADRELISATEAEGLQCQLDEAAKMLNGLIGYRRKRGALGVRESGVEYMIDDNLIPTA